VRVFALPITIALFSLSPAQISFVPKQMNKEIGEGLISEGEFSKPRRRRVERLTSQSEHSDGSLSHHEPMKNMELSGREKKGEREGKRRE